jgi:hypothetical protein
MKSSIYSAFHRRSYNGLDTVHKGKLCLESFALFLAEGCKHGVMHGMVRNADVVEALSMTNAMNRDRSHRVVGTP